jgi:ribosome biogenesis GTPase
VLGGRTAVLVGESGAGKSSLLNAFAGAALAATGDVRRTDAKGRHTTTRRELHVVPGAGILIDTPGLRALGLAAGSDAVDAAFDDVERLAAACRFRNCRHEREPGCAVAAAAEGGGLSDRRLRLYRELRRETARAELRERPHEQRRYERRFSKQVRVGERLKRGDRR